MAKLTKHAEVLNQLHTMVKKQAADAQKNISGVPGEDVKSNSISDEHETTNKNSVGPENVAQGYHQKPSDDSATPCCGPKTAETLGAEILDIIRKQGEAQDTVKGTPGDVKSESISDDKETVDKNAVKPENNTPQTTGEQKPSTDDSAPLAEAKKAEVEELAAKVASYELGRQFCAALLKSASEYSAPNEAEFTKEAGRRDFDLMIAQAAENLQSEDSLTEKKAEEAGAEYFDSILKEAALEQAIEENKTLKAKVAELESFYQKEQTKQAEAKQEQAQVEAQAKLASVVADMVLEKLKTEIVGGQPTK
jgi:hypothetical protein